jgi:hypothetical protein
MSFHLNQIDPTKTDYYGQYIDYKISRLNDRISHYGDEVSQQIDRKYNWLTGLLSSMNCAVYKDAYLEDLGDMAKQPALLFKNRVLWGGVGAILNGLGAGVSNYIAYSSGQISGARALLDTVTIAAIGGIAGYVGAYAASAEIGATLGSFIPIPGAGTLIGMGIGVGASYLVGKTLAVLAYCVENTI